VDFPAAEIIVFGNREALIVMKKLVLSLMLVVAGVGSFAQGTIVYYNRVANSVVAPLYGFEVEQIFKTGNTSAGYLPGTQTYSSAPLSGTGYSVGLWAGTTADNLAFVPGSLDSFRTGGFAGAIDNSGGVIAIPGIGEGSTAVLQLRTWNNMGGTITSWGQVLSGPAFGYGISVPFTSQPLGGNAPPPNMVGLQSFSFYPIPEPSTFLLAGLAASAWWVMRRRR
jgi:hypothetical protein